MGRSIAGAVLVLAVLCMATQAFGQIFPTGFGFPDAVTSDHLSSVFNG